MSESNNDSFISRNGALILSSLAIGASLANFAYTNSVANSLSNYTEKSSKEIEKITEILKIMQMETSKVPALEKTNAELTKALKLQSKLQKMMQIDQEKIYKDAKDASEITTRGFKLLQQTLKEKEIPFTLAELPTDIFEKEEKKKKKTKGKPKKKSVQKYSDSESESENEDEDEITSALNTLKSKRK